MTRAWWIAIAALAVGAAAQWWSFAQFQERPLSALLAGAAVMALALAPLLLCNEPSEGAQP